MPLQATSGAASYDGFGGGVAVVPTFIEDVFSCFLYTGNDSTQTITNGVNLSANGGLVWIKARTAAYSHILSDTVRGTGKFLSSNTTDAQGTDTQDVTAFNTTGFTIGNNGRVNNPSSNYVGWTFRKQPKFFDVVTWTGDGTNNRAITHSLGSVPGCIIVKNTSSAAPWAVKHRSLTASQYLVLNDTAAPATSLNPWSTNPTSSVFYVNGSSSSISNGTGSTYVAYIFAHDSGGFGLTGTDNVISCSSVTTDGSGNATVNLGYEPQFVMIKSLDAGEDWNMVDTMRGLAVSNGLYNGVRLLKPNQANAESSAAFIEPSSTGFKLAFFAAGSQTYIYIAIRRGPMKVPTVGTSVLELINLLGVTVNSLVSNTVVPDMALHVHNLGGRYLVSRLTGGINTATTSASSPRRWLQTDSTASEDTGTTGLYYNMQNASFNVAGNGADPSGGLCLSYFFRRAPSFMDTVCYTGTGTSATTFSHNLQKQPELIIVKSRSTAQNWSVAFRTTGSTYIWGLDLNTTAEGQSPFDYGANMSASIFDAYIGTTAESVNSGTTYVAYLFATCAGVSKVGSYTGTATTLQVDCGFTGGARFVLIKRTDSTGDWYVWDSARGIVAGNDPYLLLNSTAAEVTSTDYIDTYSAGFEISSTAPAAINASGGSFIFLAIS